MIHIVTGPVNSGKTTRMLQIYRSMPGGDGFILPKVYRDGHSAGQRIVHLRTGRSVYFSCKAGFLPDDWDEAGRFDAYHFTKSGLEFADAVVREALGRGCSPLFLDEIGPWELDGGGFAGLLRMCTGSGCELYAAVRTRCLEPVIAAFFAAEKIDIIPVGNGDR